MVIMNTLNVPLIKKAKPLIVKYIGLEELRKRNYIKMSMKKLEDLTVKEWAHHMLSGSTRKTTCKLSFSSLNFLEIKKK